MKLSSFSLAAQAPAARPLARPAHKADAAAATAPSKKDEMAARKLAEAKQAVATLAAVKTRTSDDEKARAAQKVKELKARLQALKMLYAGDPKKLARAAAQIARELAGAVKSYTSAGGSAAELGGIALGDATAGAATSPDDMAAEPSQGAPVADAPASDEAESEGEAKTDPQPSGTTREDESRATDAARDKADEEFKNEARDLARALKAILRRKDPRHRDDDDQRSAQQALASVDQALGALPIADIGAVAAAVTV